MTDITRIKQHIGRTKIFSFSITKKNRASVPVNQPDCSLDKVGQPCKGRLAESWLTCSLSGSKRGDLEAEQRKPRRRGLRRASKQPPREGRGNLGVAGEGRQREETRAAI